LVKNSKQTRWRFAGAAIILVAAILGIFVIASGQADADKGSGDNVVMGSSEVEDQAPASDDSFFSSALPSLVRMIGALIFVLICVYVVLYLLKRMMGKRYTGGNRGDLLEVLGTLCVAPKKSVSLIRVADKSVLVGITDNQISCLMELDASQTATLTAATATPRDQAPFAELLKSASQKIKGMGVKKTQPALDG
jgi:flagellar protein FliO/FliZ